MPVTLREALLGLVKQWQLRPEKALCADELYQILANRELVDEDEMPRCAVRGCLNRPKYETWMRNHDQMGQPTGMIIQVTICEEHTNHPWLCCNQTKETNANSQEQSSKDASL